MESLADFPDHLFSKVYTSPTSPAPFPEMLYSSRYNPNAPGNVLGVAISGGGTRSFSCGLGQLQALRQKGLLSKTAAISCNSGGSWLNTLFFYAPEPGGAGNLPEDHPVSDDQLLGTPVPPQQLDHEALHYNPPEYLGGIPSRMTDTAVGEALLDAWWMYQYSGSIREDEIWAYGLAQVLLHPYMHRSGFGSVMTLDTTTRTDLLARNPSLKGQTVRTVRSGHPYLIVTGANCYPTTAWDKTRPVEFTPMYSGMPLSFAKAGINGTTIGGEYVETAAFDSPWPNAAGTTISIPTFAGKKYGFSPQDMTGSSSSAFAEKFSESLRRSGRTLKMGSLNVLNPHFGQWPNTYLGGGADKTMYDVVDGGFYDNLAILPLLRRQYRLICSFTNTDIPLGVQTPSCSGTLNTDVYQGVSTEITRLFGLGNVSSSQPDIQVFDSADFPALRAGLLATQAAGSVPYYVGQHKIIPNQLGIPPYLVTVVWYYNGLSSDWKKQLHPYAAHLLDNDPSLANFPNYCTFQQNGIMETVWLTIKQVNLAANMWWSALTSGAAGNAIDDALAATEQSLMAATATLESRY